MDKSFDLGALLRNHQKKHKEKPAQFGSVAGGVKKRLGCNIQCRKSTRLSQFDKLRNLPTSDSQVPANNAQSKMENRRMQLEKWKKEKEIKRKEASLHKIKPFVAGVPHNSLKFEPPPPPKQMPSTSGRVTRSQSASNKNISNMTYSKTSSVTTRSQYPSFAPKNATFSAPVLNRVNITSGVLKVSSQKTDSKINIEQSLPKKEIKTSKSKPIVQHEPRNLRSRNKQETNKTKEKIVKSMSAIKITSSNSTTDINANAENIPPVKKKTPRKQIKNKKMITPDNRNANLRNETSEQLQLPKMSNLPMTPEQIIERAKKISPCVTLSRGKDNARKEMKQKIIEGLLDEDLCEKDSVEHFRRQLDSEIKRMTEMCDVWQKISNEVALPESVQEAILSAVGQARLLMSQKLQQFATLLGRCERPAPGQALVTPTDLHGFWDMVFMQVENVDMRFKKLEEMQARGWTEEQPVEIKKKVVSKPVVRSKPAATSRMRDIIAAARKAKRQQEPAENAEPPEETKTFDAGFFSVQSPVKSPVVLSTPKRNQSLLKTVLSSETKNASASKRSASYAMLRASLINKNIENGDTVCEDAVPLPPVGVTTPGLSILKSTNGKKEKRGKKSIKMVLFDTNSHETAEKIEH